MLVKRLNKFILYLSLLPTLGLFAESHEPYITVEKKGVTHRFVSLDPMTDHFTQDLFQHWQPHTFDLFDQVKDPEGIAIDLGAWIGTTSIWLANNFSHVIAVESDRASAHCLKQNLAASNCHNVTVCAQPISNLSQLVAFGPREFVLSDSITCMRSHDSTIEYLAKSITPKQLLFDFVYAKEELAPHKISFIKCNIDGGEEDILEDILHFAYNNQVKVYLSFHLDCWKSKTIDDFAYLFNYFKTRTDRVQIADPLAYLRQHPSGALLFEPLEKGVLVKKNMPVFIIGYNQYTFIKGMVEQLEKYTSDIVVVDNNSSFGPLLDYYKKNFKYTLLRQKVNQGHGVCSLPVIQKLTGDLYILTDPDLKFNPNLPAHFIEDLVQVSNHFQAFKTGFALKIDADDLDEELKFYNSSIREWENQFWTKPLVYPENTSLKLYEAAIDTTFCLINRTFANPKAPGMGQAVRVAGDYTCVHIPWHKHYQKALLAGELDAYLRKNTSSTWVHRK